MSTFLFSTVSTWDGTYEQECTLFQLCVWNREGKLVADERSKSLHTHLELTKAPWVDPGPVCARNPVYVIDATEKKEERRQRGRREIYVNEVGVEEEVCGGGV